MTSRQTKGDSHGKTESRRHGRGQQRRWMIGRPPRRFRRNTGKAHGRQVQFVNENINDADRIILRHIIFQTVREQCCLRPVFAFNETLHSVPLSGINLTDQGVSAQAGPKPDLRRLLHGGAHSTSAKGVRETMARPKRFELPTYSEQFRSVRRLALRR